jgi:hypothetical protein
MNLQETKETILRWLSSCQTSEQCDLLIEVIDRFVYQRFEGIVPPFDLDLVKTDLKQAWIDQKLKVVSNAAMQSKN